MQSREQEEKPLPSRTSLCLWLGERMERVIIIEHAGAAEETDVAKLPEEQVSSSLLWMSG